MGPPRIAGTKKRLPLGITVSTVLVLAEGHTTLYRLLYIQQLGVQTRLCLVFTCLGLVCVHKGVWWRLTCAIQVRDVVVPAVKAR